MPSMLNSSPWQIWKPRSRQHHPPTRWCQIPGAGAGFLLKFFRIPASDLAWHFTLAMKRNSSSINTKNAVVWPPSIPSGNPCALGRRKQRVQWEVHSVPSDWQARCSQARLGSHPFASAGCGPQGDPHSPLPGGELGKASIQCLLWEGVVMATTGD